MKSFFEKINYVISTPEIGTKLDYYTIANADGSPRWIFPVQTKTPLFLKFYHVEGLRSRVFAFISSVIFNCRLQPLFYKNNTVHLASIADQESPKINLFDAQWALFTGTAGPNNKMVLYTETADQPSFYKIPVTEASLEIIKREYSGVSKAISLKPETFTFPQASLHANGMLEIEDISGSGLRSNQFSTPHMLMLDEMYEKTAKKCATAESRNFVASMELLNESSLSNDQRIPRSLVHRLRQLGSELEKEDMVFTLSHGDFTPWNMFTRGTKLAVYDWELADEETPIGFDALHFIIQKGILIDRKSWKEIRNEINEVTGDWGRTIGTRYEIEWNLCLKFYLFMNISNHIELYRRQQEWHEQIFWLLETWSEALSDLLAENQSARGLVIEDLFVSLSDKPYATIKFPVIEPSALDVYSDIDICLGKHDATILVNRLKNHTLVQTVIEKKSTLMTSIQLILKHNDVLNIDLIWQLKWKQLEMMSTQTVLNNAQINPFGIKVMHSADLVRYLGLFYGLNGSEIPLRHAHYLTSENLSNDALNRIIISSHTIGEVPQTKLQEKVQCNSANRGMQKIKNGFNYVLDSIKSLFRPKGMIITFSGVDGAGKSTVIEHIRNEFDKKLRKRVVVIRHRPSVLPILSAWTKGKAKAEKDAASTLPRQGSNRSYISSLLRFAYYYTDYVAGQFVVYVRHVLRGDVVLYDRYYFDFINDSVRSNIHLPEKFLRAGYFFLMKPDFNFFLYADADTILARKQELDKKTITELTTKYLSLFNDLDSGNISSGKYLPILNNKLDVTIRKIMDKTTGEAA